MRCLGLSSKKRTVRMLKRRSSSGYQELGQRHLPNARILERSGQEPLEYWINSDWLHGCSVYICACRWVKGDPRVAFNDNKDKDIIM
jgi:restriction endonuclease Mrr